MNKCYECGKEDDSAFKRGRCGECRARARKAFRETFAAEFNAGFMEADEEIRNSNPHIYGADEAKPGFDYTAFRYAKWDGASIDEETIRRLNEEIRKRHEQYVHDIFNREYTNSFFTDPPFTQRPKKQSWPKPEIFWLPDFNGWRVKDPVTEGYVDVPVEAVEAKLGRGIEAGLRARVIYRSEIEECAKRILILLLYGCPQRLEAKYDNFPQRFREAFYSACVTG